jgi:hypothetical protein
VPLFRDPRTGFRFSRFDAVLLILGVAGSVATWNLPGSPGALVAIVIGHFFLFCNVFTIRRSFEVAWAVMFVALSAMLVIWAEKDWLLALMFVSPLTLVLVTLEIRSGHYHGVLSESRLLAHLRGPRRPSSQATSGEVMWLVLSVFMLPVAALLYLVNAPLCRSPSKWKTARLDVTEIRHAALLWRLTHEADRCPSLGDLVRDNVLDPVSAQDDPWGKPYIIECLGDDVTIRSSGRDGDLGTVDDVQAPSER